MSHQRDTATLRSCTEEGYLGPLLLQLSSIEHQRVPGSFAASQGFMILRTVDGCSKPGVYHDGSFETDLEEWGQGRTEVPYVKSAGFPGNTAY